MCGIFGVAGVINPQAKRLFDQGLYIDAVRGWGSTGLLTVDPTAGETEVLKKPVSAADFIRIPEYEKTRDHMRCLWLGHNRAATIGDISEENAHPFEHGDIIGVHNGTLRRGWWKHLGYKEKEFEVDSDAIFHHMNEHGPEDTIAKLDGDYALVWYNKQEHTMNMIRNSGRPFFYSLTQNRDMLWFASDALIWKLAAQYSRGAHTSRTLSHPENKMRVLPEDTWFKIDLPDNRIRSKWTTEDALPRVKLEGGTNLKKPTPLVVHNGGYSKQPKGRINDASVIKTVDSVIAEFEQSSVDRYENNEYLSYLCDRAATSDEKEVQIKIAEYQKDIQNLGAIKTVDMAKQWRTLQQGKLFWTDIKDVMSGDFWSYWEEKEEEAEKKPSQRVLN